MRELRVELELIGVVCDRLISSKSRLDGGTRDEPLRLLGVNEFIRCMPRLRPLPLPSVQLSLMKGATNGCSQIFRASARCGRGVWRGQGQQTMCMSATITAGRT